MSLRQLRVLAVMVAFTAITAVTAPAAQFTVQDTGVTPHEMINMDIPGWGPFGVFAGMHRLIVDGTPMDGFCIDPFHFSRGSSPGYQYVALEDGPKENLMGRQNAVLISRLWGSNYTPNMSAEDAAGVQIAIWMLVAGDAFHLNSGNDYGAAGLLSAVQDAKYAGPTAALIAISGPGQDYVVFDFSSVPEGGSTIAFLGLALCGLVAASRLRPGQTC